MELELVAAQPSGWDATAEIAVAVFIQDYLAAHPPDADAVTAGDLEHWAGRLLHSGQARLAALEAVA